MIGNSMRTSAKASRAAASVLARPVLLLATLTIASLVSAFAPSPCQAADAIFPLGSRVGLVPPEGMVASDRFVGFADPNKDAAILITLLPATAYAQIEKNVQTEVLRKQGVNLDKREPIALTIGKAILFTGHQVADKIRFRKWLLVAGAEDLTVLVTVQIPQNDSSYTERAVRASLATLTVRATMPEAEELGLLPFAVRDFAGFHVDGALRGQLLMLSDAPRGEAGATPGSRFEARMLIAALPGGPSDPNDHANFARLAFNEIGGFRDVHVTMSEPLRFGGQSGYQTMAEAKDTRTGTDVMVVQWLRFGSSGFLQIIGVGRTENWPSVLARLRTVRDSIEPK